ncbi:hypothetical protein F4677DRAFT_235567 [Hypoxylon crocopeplum]|nr:hypothetical protein F4677DRAFT_235567 [Hypoxylon crocopeplum]
MSGFEVAGVVLGAIPLVISALEHYKEGKGVAASFVKWRGQLDTLIFRLKLQRTFFYLQILELLRGAGVEDVAGRLDVTEEECVFILQNAKNGAEVQEYLGLLYDTFLEVLDRYEKCLKAIAAKLGHIHRPPNVAKDDLVAILGANPPARGSFAFKERVTFTIEKGSLKGLVEELREDRLSLKTIVKGMKTQQEYTAKQPSHDAGRLAKIFAQVQSTATPLFAAVCKVCICKCPSKHKVLMRLDNRVPLHKERPKLGRKATEQTTFSLVFELEEFLQEAIVKASQPADDVETEIPKQNGTTKGRTVKFPTIVVNPVPEDYSNDFKKPRRVIDICQYACEARLSGRVLRLELTKDDLSLLEEGSEPRRNFSSSTTLEDFLRNGVRDEDARMTPKQQTLLALDVAASILQLRQTCWFNLPFNSKGIKFLVHDGGNMKRAILGPFVEQMMGGPSRVPDAAGGPDPKTALLELAILLLEIWHHKPLEMWMAKTGMESAESKEARRIAAIRWLEMTSERLPPHHLTAIEQCLAICSGRLQFWNDGDFLKQYCENIIKPLQESCRAW